MASINRLWLRRVPEMRIGGDARERVRRRPCLPSGNADVKCRCGTVVCMTAQLLEGFCALLRSRPSQYMLNRVSSALVHVSERELSTSPCCGTRYRVGV